MITLVDITFDAYCLLSPTKIVSRFRKTQNWGWRRPLGALKNRNPVSAETSWELNFGSKTSPTNVKLDLSPFKVSCFHVFESSSHDPKILKTTPGIDSAFKCRGCISLFQQSQTNSSSHPKDFLSKSNFYLYFLPLSITVDIRFGICIKFWSIWKKRLSKTDRFYQFYMALRLADLSTCSVWKKNFLSLGYSGCISAKI